MGEGANIGPYSANEAIIWGFLGLPPSPTIPYMFSDMAEGQSFRGNLIYGLNLSGCPTASSGDFGSNQQIKWGAVVVGVPLAGRLETTLVWLPLKWAKALPSCQPPEKSVRKSSNRQHAPGGLVAAAA